ncbi:2043_t:CDS:2, partial [Cetraspora pellucida]
MVQVNYHKHRQEQQYKRREISRIKRQQACIEKDTKAKEANIPLRILELKNEFNLLKKQYANWPQPIDKIIANNVLAEFRDNTSCNKLRELCCAICSGLFSQEYLTIKNTRKIHLPLLEINKAFERSFFEIDFTYRHPHIDGSDCKILLDRNGFINQNSNNNENPFDLQVCYSCKRSLDMNKTPLFSLANTWIGPTPPCLQGLTILEQLLISTGYLCINLIQLTNQKHTHYKVKVVFIGEGQPSEEQLKKVLHVRKHKVVIALNWLMEHNVLYKNVKLNEIILNSLLENEIPIALKATTVVVNINPEEIQHHTGYMVDLVDNDDNYVEDKLNNEEEVFNYNELYNPKIVQESSNNGKDSSEVILIPHSNKPINKYTDSTLLPVGILVLFPYGIGGHKDKFRKQHILFKQYIKHLLQLYDCKFRYHHSFIFATFDILQRKDIASKTYLMAKHANFKRSAELISELVPHNIKIAIKQEQNNQPVTNKFVLELLRNVNIVGEKIMGSHQSCNCLCNEIHAVTIQDGTPLLFLTINPTDLHNPIVMMYVGKEIDINALFLENFSTATKRVRLAHLDPIAVVKYYNILTRHIIKFILSYRRSNGGVLDEIKNYYVVTEYQDRGTPHCHILVWLHGASNPIEIQDCLQYDKDFRIQLMNYVNEIVKEDISYLFPNGNYITDKMLNAEYKTQNTMLEKKIHTSFLPIPNPQTPTFNENFRLDILAITKLTLVHKCTRSCKKYHHGKMTNCHFDFPYELVKAPGKIYPELGIIVLQCLNAYINNHNLYITTSCYKNNNIKFIATVKLVLAYIHYITDYITKTDINTHNSFLMYAIILNKFIMQTSDELSREYVIKSWQLITICLNKIIEQAEMTGPQILACLLNINDHYTPNKFVLIYLDSFETYLTLQYPIEYSSKLTNLEDQNSNTANKKEAYQENEIISDEMFTIANSGNRITADNLQIDY